MKTPGPATVPDSPTPLLTEAADWLLRLRDEGVTEEEVGAWLKWCAEDRAHLEAFERMQQLYDGLKRLTPEEQYDLQPPDQAHKGIEGRVGVAHVIENLKSLLPGPRGALAALLGLVILFVFMLNRLGPGSDYHAAWRTQRPVQLADLTEVTLASESEFSSRYTAHRRYVDLRAGEAYFEVHPDHARPFVVTAGPMTVTAVGTKFNVRRAGLRTVVAVVEGAVDVASDSATVRVRAGQQAIEDSDRAGIVVSDTAVAAAVAWREGRLEYTLEPLSGVIADVNRYAMHRIVIGDAELNNQLFTGTVFVDRIDEWAQTLPAAFALTAVVNADGTVTLTARHTDPNPDFR